MSDVTFSYRDVNAKIPLLFKFYFYIYYYALASTLSFTLLTNANLCVFILSRFFGNKKPYQRKKQRQNTTKQRNTR